MTAEPLPNCFSASPVVQVSQPNALPSVSLGGSSAATSSSSEVAKTSNIMNTNPHSYVQANAFTTFSSSITTLTTTNTSTTVASSKPSQTSVAHSTELNHRVSQKDTSVPKFTLSSTSTIPSSTASVSLASLVADSANTARLPFPQVPKTSAPNIGAPVNVSVPLITVYSNPEMRSANAVGGGKPGASTGLTTVMLANSKLPTSTITGVSSAFIRPVFTSSGQVSMAVASTIVLTCSVNTSFVVTPSHSSLGGFAATVTSISATVITTPSIAPPETNVISNATVVTFSAMKTVVSSPIVSSMGAGTIIKTDPGVILTSRVDKGGNSNNSTFSNALMKLENSEDAKQLNRTLSAISTGAYTTISSASFLDGMSSSIVMHNPISHSKISPGLLSKLQESGSAISTASLLSGSMVGLQAGLGQVQGESQNALLKQLLQNTACASSNQAPEGTAFPFATTAAKTVVVDTVTPSSNLSEEATKIPQTSFARTQIPSTAPIEQPSVTLSSTVQEAELEPMKIERKLCFVTVIMHM